MKACIAALAFVVALGCTVETTASGDVWALASTPAHRVVIERVCNPEHCASRGRLEWKGAAGELTAVALVNELEEPGTLFVSSVVPRQDGEEVAFELQVDDPRADTSELWRLVPEEPPRYRIERP